eukprot:s3290_g6.t1
MYSIRTGPGALEFPGPGLWQLPLASSACPTRQAPARIQQDLGKGLLAVLAREKAQQDGLADAGFLLAVLEVQAGLTAPAAPTKQKVRLLCNRSVAAVRG